MICSRFFAKPVPCSMAISCCAPACIAGNFSSAPFCFNTRTLPRKCADDWPTSCATSPAMQSSRRPLAELSSGRKWVVARPAPHLREKEGGSLVLRRGFTISPDEKFIIAEDVVTRGGRVQETIDIVRAHGAVVAGVGVIVDRSGLQKPDFGCPFVSLMQLNVETFAADQIPGDLVSIPAVKPGSR